MPKRSIASIFCSKVCSNGDRLSGCKTSARVGSKVTTVAASPCSGSLDNAIHDRFDDRVQRRRRQNNDGGSFDLANSVVANFHQLSSPLSIVSDLYMLRQMPAGFGVFDVMRDVRQQRRDALQQFMYSSA